MVPPYSPMALSKGFLGVPTGRIPGLVDGVCPQRQVIAEGLVVGFLMH